MSLKPDDIKRHVSMWDGLPLAIRTAPSEETLSHWPAHRRFVGTVKFFVNIYRQLLNGADLLAEAADQPLDALRSPLSDQIKTVGLRRPADRSLHFAHEHHEVEGHGFFLRFIRHWLELENTRDPLNADRQVLDERLNRVETAATNLRQRDRDGIAALHRHAKVPIMIACRQIRGERAVTIPVLQHHG